MSNARLVITAVVLKGRQQAEVARTYGVSPGWVSKLVKRFRAEGEAAYEPRSRRPNTSPRALPATTIEVITATRTELADRGHDAGPHPPVDKNYGRRPTRPTTSAPCSTTLHHNPIRPLPSTTIPIRG